VWLLRVLFVEGARYITDTWVFGLAGGAILTTVMRAVFLSGTAIALATGRCRRILSSCAPLCNRTTMTMHPRDLVDALDAATYGNASMDILVFHVRG
jgi:hypothetical protein